MSQVSQPNRPATATQGQPSNTARHQNQLQSDGMASLLNRRDERPSGPGTGRIGTADRQRPGGADRTWNGYGADEQASAYPEYPRQQKNKGAGQKGTSQVKAFTHRQDSDEEDTNIDWLTLQPKQRNAAKQSTQSGGGGGEPKVAWTSKAKNDEQAGMRPTNNKQKFLAGDGVLNATQGDNDPGRAQKLKNVEDNLLKLNMEKDKYKIELDKIPENAKTIAQIRRRQHLESELKVIGKNISNMKQKLRGMGELGSNI